MLKEIDGLFDEHDTNELQKINVDQINIVIISIEKEKIIQSFQNIDT